MLKLLVPPLNANRRTPLRERRRGKRIPNLIVFTIIFVVGVVAAPIADANWYQRYQLVPSPRYVGGTRIPDLPGRDPKAHESTLKAYLERMRGLPTSSEAGSPVMLGLGDPFKASLHYEGNPAQEDLVTATHLATLMTGRLTEDGFGLSRSPDAARQLVDLATGVIQVGIRDLHGVAPTIRAGGDPGLCRSSTSNPAYVAAGSAGESAAGCALERCEQAGGPYSASPSNACPSIAQYERQAGLPIELDDAAIGKVTPFFCKKPLSELFKSPKNLVFCDSDALPCALDPAIASMRQAEALHQPPPGGPKAIFSGALRESLTGLRFDPHLSMINGCKKASESGNRGGFSAIAEAREIGATRPTPGRDPSFRTIGLFQSLAPPNGGASADLDRLLLDVVPLFNAFSANDPVAALRLAGPVKQLLIAHPEFGQQLSRFQAVSCASIGAAYGAQMIRRAIQARVPPQDSRLQRCRDEYLLGVEAMREVCRLRARPAPANQACVNPGKGDPPTYLRYLACFHMGLQVGAVMRADPTQERNESYQTCRPPLAQPAGDERTGGRSGKPAKGAADPTAPGAR